MTPEQNDEAERYFEKKKADENPVQKLEGWGHDCGYHSDTESLFLAHIENCPPPTVKPSRKRKRHG